MANNQPFVLKNAVEVGKNIDVTLGTISSSTVDLSTGNYFNDTLTADKTYTFSNPGDVQSFQMEITGGNTTFYGLNPAPTYTSNSKSFASQESTPQGMWFKPDGTILYVIGFGNSPDRVHQYSLSTAWDLGTATYASKYGNANQDTVNKDIQLKPDGTVAFAYGAANEIMYQYNLSTAWDISTMSYASKQANFSSLGPSASNRNGVFIGDSGTKMYMVAGSSYNTVYQYNMSTAWDVSTASYASKSFSMNSQNSNCHKIIFNDAGTTMILVGQNPFKLFQYTLSTAWDVSTASYSGYDFNPSSQMSSCLDAFANEDGDLYILDENTDTAFQYAMETAAAITWPSSVKWNNDSAPDNPASGEKDMFSFVTPDDGTTYYGFKSATNVS